MSAHKTIYFVTGISVILFSCNYNRQQKDTTAGISNETQQSDTITIAPENAVSITEYSNDYQQGITQTFIASANKITLLKGRKGLKITVNPAALVMEDGSAVDGNIEVKMIELTNSEELFKSNAATISNGRLLASGGSYFIGMQCRGRQVKLRQGKHLEVEFPKIKEEEMELFFGNRTATGDMNWEKASSDLQFSESYSYNYIPYDPPYKDSSSTMMYKSKYHLFDSVTTKVFLMNETMTVKEMVEKLQQRGVDKNIDSLFLTWENFYGAGYKGSCKNPFVPIVKKYRIISCKNLEAERDSLGKLDKAKQVQLEANRKYNAEWNAKVYEGRLSNQLLTYYAPSSVTQLGWINCDRFYNKPTDIEVSLELPYTFNNSQIQYFLIYKSFNGLMSGVLAKNKQQQFCLYNLPNGEAVTLIAFTKTNGQAYQYKEDFVTGAGKTLKADFKPIAKEELKKIFGANIKI